MAGVLTSNPVCDGDGFRRAAHRIAEFFDRRSVDAGGGSISSIIAALEAPKFEDFASPSNWDRLREHIRLLEAGYRLSVAFDSLGDLIPTATLIHLTESSLDPAAPRHLDIAEGDDLLVFHLPHVGAAAAADADDGDVEFFVFLKAAR